MFTFSFVINWILEFFLGQRVSIETELAGLDIPEMGQLGYPEFVFRPEPDFMQAADTWRLSRRLCASCRMAS